MSRKLASLTTFAVVFLTPMLALAAGSPTASGERGAYGIAMALAVGLAALGGGMGQGRAVAAALQGIARNPNSSGKVLVPMLLGLAFIESLVIFALLISFTVGGNITSTLAS